MAHFLRAFYYSRIATNFCLPYGDKTKNCPGLPINTDISYTIDTKRGTLEELYTFIIQDLEKAIELIKREPMESKQKKMYDHLRLLHTLYLHVNIFSWRSIMKHQKWSSWLLIQICNPSILIMD